MGYQETIKYKKQFGMANAPNRYAISDGFKLGSWQGNQKRICNKGRLGKARISRLEDIGFLWDQLEETWENGYQETLKYKKQFGKANAPKRYKTPDGFNLGMWQQHQKGYYNRDKLDKARIKKLEGLGFIWNSLDEAWEMGYQKTIKYKKQFGMANAPVRYTTSDGFKLGIWQSNQKGRYDKGKLDKERIKKLEDIGFVWDQLEEAWERGYQETLKYKQEFGNANAPQRYKAPDGFKLGWWQGTQKGNYDKGKLDKEGIKRLEEIGFIWNPLDDAWGMGYQKTIKYKKQFGMANAPVRYTTLEGFKLGIWQSNQKGRYDKRKLDKERIKKLEKIGFVWDMRKR